MRTAKRVAAPGIALFFIIVFLWTYFSQVRRPESLGGHEQSSAEDGDEWPQPGDKILVMAKMETENTDWVDENLPEYCPASHPSHLDLLRLSSWQHAIYHMDDPQGDFRVPQNKGRESMAYLTYLIDHYASLPSTIAFVHSHRDGWPTGWHTDAAGYDNVVSLRTVQIPYVQDKGYANLRCLHVPGCPDEIQPFRDPPDPGRDAEQAMPDAWAYVFGNASEVPRVIGAACCSQFAVSRKQVLLRPVQDYRRLRDWLLQTPLPDNTSGRVTEYMWHILFGREPVHCPELSTCYCDVYGKC